MYTAADIRPLAQADEIGGQLCGPAAGEVLRRQCEVFGDAHFKRLSRLSVSHLYNLRRSKTCRTQRTTFERAKPTAARIGERRPDPDGQPGHVRVDTVHQGDRNGAKGLYHLNLVAMSRRRNARLPRAGVDETRPKGVERRLRVRVQNAYPGNRHRLGRPRPG